jgi:hypothetical protein
MSIKDLQKDIRKNEGYILSDGTLNLTHLLPKAYDLLVGYNMQSQTAKDLKKAIEGVFENVGNEQTEKYLPTFENQYFYNIRLIQTNEKQDEASYIWNEDIFNYFNNIAPNKYYFGCSEGDCACIGWFKCENDEF